MIMGQKTEAINAKKQAFRVIRREDEYCSAKKHITHIERYKKAENRAILFIIALLLMANIYALESPEKEERKISICLNKMRTEQEKAQWPLHRIYDAIKEYIPDRWEIDSPVCNTLSVYLNRGKNAEEFFMAFGQIERILCEELVFLGLHELYPASIEEELISTVLNKTQVLREIRFANLTEGLVGKKQNSFRRNIKKRPLLQSNTPGELEKLEPLTDRDIVWRALRIEDCSGGAVEQILLLLEKYLKKDFKRWQSLQIRRIMNWTSTKNLKRYVWGDTLKHVVFESIYGLNDLDFSFLNGTPGIISISLPTEFEYSRITTSAYWKNHGGSLQKTYSKSKETYKKKQDVSKEKFFVDRHMLYNSEKNRKKAKQILDFLKTCMTIREFSSSFEKIPLQIVKRNQRAIWQLGEHPTREIILNIGSFSEAKGKKLVSNLKEIEIIMAYRVIIECDPESSVSLSNYRVVCALLSRLEGGTSIVFRGFSQELISKKLKIVKMRDGKFSLFFISCSELAVLKILNSMNDHISKVEELSLINCAVKGTNVLWKRRWKSLRWVRMYALSDLVSLNLSFLDKSDSKYIHLHLDTFKSLETIAIPKKHIERSANICFYFLDSSYGEEMKKCLASCLSSKKSYPVKKA
ncbi:hypothetical protein NEFER03_1958 [Nematocida sp. LUAm3]|nr:hypothetical protein NEFER03_1958 [Nematocida sp. LUAm3]KAI5176042.1 hypothetical protein NEFER02_1876 [Nematocida sp. LUAm2]KAI5177086.1 hypothetical protein NEFER01_0361 [Nematocida sp. LUAm1]